MGEILAEGIVAIASYVIALKLYKLCNRIDTTPIFPPNFSFEHTDKPIEEQSDRLLGSVKPEKYYCEFCKIICDYRTRHCRKCNACIERYDHHCFWIGNCVGRHNHRQFYYFLGVQTVNNISVFLLISGLQALKEWEVWLQWVGMLLALGFCCFTGYLLFYHTMLISCGITTWEHMRKTKISYLKYLPPGFNPFSKGVISNWRIFLTEQTRANGCQEVQSWDDQIPTFQEAKQIKAGCNII